MSAMTIGLILFALLFLFLASGLWVGLCLLLVGFVSIAIFTPAPAGSLLATTLWDKSWSWPLTALPLFIWMGEILTRSKLSEYMFNGLAPWMGRIPGRLLHVNLLGCTMMAAVSGSSAVTSATIGRMSLPELERRGYDQGLAIGTLAGAGTLGLLIPPSIMMIVYGIVAQQSISKLFIAGVIPGFLIIGLFFSYIVIWSLLNKDKVPANDIHMSFVEKIQNSKKLIPIILLLVLVVASIYTGVATPTEAATLGVLGSLLLAALNGTMNHQMLKESLMRSVQITCMITFIIAGAGLLSVGMAFTGIPTAIATSVSELGLSPYALLVALTLIYIVLGCFLEGASMIVLTASVALPMIQAAGIDPIWFGIYLIIMVEMAQITPPVGMNLFVMQAMSGRDIWSVTRASAPFFFLMLLGIVILAMFPGLVSFLPNLMK